MKTTGNFFKQFILIVFLCIISVIGNAQRKYDQVKLKNGNVLKGKIVRQVSNQFIELETIDRNFWKFDLEDVAEIQYRKRKKVFTNFKVDTNTVLQNNSRFFYEMNFGVLVGDNSNKSNAPFSFLTQLTYRSKSGIALGIGAGYETFYDAMLPVFADVRWHSKMKSIPVWFSCMGGYSFAIEDKNDIVYMYSQPEIDSKGGWMINPGIGIRLAKLPQASINLRIGYRYQKIEHEWYDPYREDHESLQEEINRLSIHLGFLF